jgi:hypothetical protein
MTAGYPRRSLNSSTTLIHRLSRCTSPAPLPGRGRSRPRRGFAGERSHLMSPVPLPRRNRTGPPRDRRSGRSVTCSRATGLGKCSEKAGRFRIGRITGKRSSLMARLPTPFPRPRTPPRIRMRQCWGGPRPRRRRRGRSANGSGGRRAPVGPLPRKVGRAVAGRKAPLERPSASRKPRPSMPPSPATPTLQASGVNVTV